MSEIKTNEKNSYEGSCIVCLHKHIAQYAPDILLRGSKQFAIAIKIQDTF